MKKYLFLFLIGLILILPLRVYSQTQNTVFAQVFYQTNNGLNQLFILSSFTVEYETGENPQDRYFLGLFEQNNLSQLDKTEYQYQIIDDNITDTGLDDYRFVSIINDGDEDKLTVLGKTFKLAEKKYLFKIPNDDFDDNKLTQFFVAKLPVKPLPTPLSQPITSTPSPTQPSQSRSAIIPIIIILVAVGSLLLFIFLFFTLFRKKLQNKSPLM